MKSLPQHLVAAIAFLSPSAFAQESVANFDVVPEGSGTTHYVEDGLRFDQLDLYNGNGPTASFSIEDASLQLGGFPDFSSPNTLDTGPVIPGSIGTAGRIGSFRILPFSQCTHADVRLYVNPGSSAGNKITLRASLGAAIVAEQLISIPAGGWTQLDLNLGGLNPFDRLDIIGTGPSNDGAFFGLVDEVRVVRARVGTEFCFGDGTAGACPCGNFGGQLEGCTNSTGLGAYALGYGSTSLILDNLEISSGQLPPNVPALLFSSQVSLPNAGSPFGDGLRCVVGAIKRQGVQVADGIGLAVWDDHVLTTSSAISGQSHYFQVWYRNPGGSCGSGFNVSSAVSVMVTN